MNLSDVPIDFSGILPVQEGHNFTLVQNCYAWCYNNTVKMTAATPTYILIIYLLFMMYCKTPEGKKFEIADRSFDQKKAVGLLLETVIIIAGVHALLMFFMKRF